MTGPEPAAPAPSTKAVSFRLPPDVVESIASEARRLGVSQARYVANLVRMGGILAALSEDLAERHSATVEEAGEALGRACRGAAVLGTPEKCAHPLNRRIGKGCGACGEAVK